MRLQKSNEEVVAAKSVLVIGGGAVGVELAGQLRVLNSSFVLTFCFS